MPGSSIPPLVAGWFAGRGWQVRRHQAEVLARVREGRHVLLAADTGAGKTLAGFMPVLADAATGAMPEGLHTLYVSPLKALAHDVQRNLMTPVAEMGLNLRVEARIGDTSSDRKARQRADPPHVLLTTPESLSLLLSYPESATIFASLRHVVIDEIHALAASKRGDLLALALARLQVLAPAMRRIGLSATLADPEGFCGWIAPGGDIASVAMVAGEAGAPPQVSILLPQGERIPWSGHAASWAIPQIYELIQRHRTTLIFTNTRFLAEYTFRLLWDVNDANLPIGIHHGSLSQEARHKAEAAMADSRLRALVCTASLDLGVDWGDIDLVVQMGAPKGSSRLLQRIGRANHRLDCPSKAVLVPGNRFEFLEAVAAVEAVRDGQRDGEGLRPGSLDVLAQHVLGIACAGPFDAAALHREVVSATPYAGIDAADWERVLNFVATGGYALRAYDRFRRIVREREGPWRLSHPDMARGYRLNAGIIVDADMVEVGFRNGRSLGRVEEDFAASLGPGDTFRFAGLDLEVEGLREGALLVRAAKRAAAIPSYNGARIAISSHLADRVRGLLADPARWRDFPPDVLEWLMMQRRVSTIPRVGELLVESFPHAGRAYTVFYTFEGWPANQSLGMLVTRRMEHLGLAPMGFVANDYALAVWGLTPMEDPAALLSPDILVDEFVEWVENSYLLRRAFREVSVISGLIERQVPGKRKSNRQVTFSSDLIYDVLRRYEPDHLLLQAAWADARQGMTDVARVAEVLERAQRSIRHIDLARVSPLAVPTLTMIGRESLPAGAADDALLLEAEALATIAMGPGAMGPGAMGE